MLLGNCVNSACAVWNFQIFQVLHNISTWNFMLYSATQYNWNLYHNPWKVMRTEWPNKFKFPLLSFYLICHSESEVIYFLILQKYKYLIILAKEYIKPYSPPLLFCLNYHKRILNLKGNSVFLSTGSNLKKSITRRAEEIAKK